MQTLASPDTLAARHIKDRGHELRFGLVAPPMWRSWDELLDLWSRAERAGFDMAFTTDHFQSDWGGDHGPVLEAWATLAGLAREVPRLLLGTYVSGITHRPLAVLAKQAVTVDHLSGGRLILGPGGGLERAGASGVRLALSARRRACRTCRGSLGGPAAPGIRTADDLPGTVHPA